jgi:predicted permease
MFKRFEFRFLTTFLGEIVVLVVLWVFLIIGAGVASVRYIFFLQSQQQLISSLSVSGLLRPAGATSRGVNNSNLAESCPRSWDSHG